MSTDDKALEIPDTLPLLPVRDIVVFPYMILAKSTNYIISIYVIRKVNE